MNAFASLAEAWAQVVWAVTWQVAALAGVALLGEWLLRLRAPRVRHALWWCVLLAPLMLAPGRMVLERHDAVVEVALLPAAREAPAPVLLPPSPRAGQGRIERAAPSPTQVAREEIARGLGAIGESGLAAAWLLGVLLLLGRLVVGHRYARRLVRGSVPVEDPSLRERLARLAARAGLRREVALRANRELGGPVVYGLRRPVILVPTRWIAELPGEDLEALLAHEVAHVRRRDLPANAAQRLLEAALFFHPAAWLASRRITLAREELCDAWALAQGAEAQRYARALTEAAAQAQGQLAAALVGVAESRFTLLRRVKLVLQGARPANRRATVAMGTVVVAALAMCAGAQVVHQGEPGRGEAVITKSNGPTVITGVLLQPDRQPAADVQVMLSAASAGRNAEGHFETYGGPTRTDAEGRFEFTIDHALFPVTCTITALDKQLYAVAVKGLKVKRGQRVQLPKTVMEEGGTITGRVLDVDTGEPVAGISVHCQPLPDPDPMGGLTTETGATTDEEGRYSVSAPPGRAHLDVGLGSRAEGSYTWYHRATRGTWEGKSGILLVDDKQKPPFRVLTISSGDRQEGMDLYVQREAVVRGTVVKPDGTPAAHAEVQGPPDVGEGRVVHSNVGWQVMDRADAEGRFLLHGTLPGVPIVVQAYVEGETLAVATHVMPTRERATEVTLRLRPTPVLTGRVLLPDKKPAVGAEVGVFAFNGPKGEKTDAQGRFRLRSGMYGAPFSVVASVWEWAEQRPRKIRWIGHSRPVELREGEKRVDVGDIVLADYAALIRRAQEEAER